MMRMDLQVDTDEFQKGIAELEADAGRKMVMTMEMIGWETISFLRSLGHGMQKPVRVSEGPRSAHPGGWADISSNLANSYRFEIHAGGTRIRWSSIIEPSTADRGNVKPISMFGSMPLSPQPPFVLWFFNDMEYAAALEAKDGYFVLSGVTNAGGEIEQAMRRTLTTLGFDIG